MLRRGPLGCLLIAPILLSVFLVLAAPIAGADEIMIETFEEQPETRWRFFTDGVMGGVSQGQASFDREDDRPFARMTGTVSTENNGGFIQIRMDLPPGAAQGTSGIRLVARGNNERYFVHLRTRATLLPWQYYQQGFEVGPDWAEVELPFDAFEPSGALLPSTPGTGGLKSIGIVAFGRDHEAQIDIRELGFY
ncbi:MAG: CIA30 family protein [Pseudomonadota bacterium]